MKKVILISGILFFSTLLFAQSTFFWIEDVPWDDGKALNIKANVPADTVYLQKALEDGTWETIYTGRGRSLSFTQNELNPDFKYRYRLLVPRPAFNDTIFFMAEAQPKEQWFYLHKLSYLLILLAVSIAIIYYVQNARKGKEYYIRRISGLDCIEDSIGRATEKGKPILFVPGIMDLDDIQTISSLTILSHLAHKVAEYDTEIIVPCRFSMVLSAAREVVKEAYIKAEKPDAYNQDRIFYLTDDQFGYVAGIDGIMVREQPAANFFLGSFYAESLILAETGFSTGAIQTAGTAQASQLPFFVVSCDYTLIGEELFAASAYLSRDPQQLGSLKGHDFGKLLVILLIIAGVITEMSGWHWFKAFFEGAQ